MRKPKRRPVKLKRILPEIVGTERHHIAAQIESLFNSEAWRLVKGILAEDIFTHEMAMRSFIKHGDKVHEAAYEAGNMEALEYVAERMLPETAKALREGKQAGLIEEERPSEEIAPGSVTARQEE